MVIKHVRIEYFGEFEALYHRLGNLKYLLETVDALQVDLATFYYDFETLAALLLLQLDLSLLVEEFLVVTGDFASFEGPLEPSLL